MEVLCRCGREHHVHVYVHLLLGNVGVVGELKKIVNRYIFIETREIYLPATFALYGNWNAQDQHHLDHEGGAGQCRSASAI